MHHIQQECQTIGLNPDCSCTEIYIYIYIYNTLGSGTSGCLNVYKNGKQEKKKKLTFCELKA
jgi:hypothetical protein